MFVLHKKGAVAVKSSTFTPSLRAAAPVAAATGRATRAMPATIVMAEAKKSVKDLPASALQGKKVCSFSNTGQDCRSLTLQENVTRRDCTSHERCL